MNLRRLYFALKLKLIVVLDQFVSWPPLAQLPVLLVFTLAVVAGWAMLWSSTTAAPLGESLWAALTRFMDGGTMATDQGDAVRFVATGTTATGVLVVSFLTGAFASKLGERLEELRAGRSPTLQRNHILILGFDPKVPLIVRELARSHQRLSIVILSGEDKGRVEAVLRPFRQLAGSRIRVVCRTGDPRSELALLGVCADRARAIVVTAPPHLDDERALRVTVSTLLAVRSFVGPGFAGRIVVETRRSIHASIVALTGEPGVAGAAGLPMDIFATDDIVARVLAQSIRLGGVYFALRELLSFRGSELYLEPVPEALAGTTFDEAHARISGGIMVGARFAGQAPVLCPPFGDSRRFQHADQLIVLEQDPCAFSVQGALPSAGAGAEHRLVHADAQRIRIVGSNRTLPRLVAELDCILPQGSTLELLTPNLSAMDRQALAVVTAALRRVRVEHSERGTSELAFAEDEGLSATDGVVILGCEDEHDPDGDASALSILLRLRQAQRRKPLRIRRLITEVRDPSAAQQVFGSRDDFLVSLDVVAMLLAKAAVDPGLIPAYRELLDPSGVEIFLVPMERYGLAEGATFADAMAAARTRGQVAIGFFPHQRVNREISTRARIELGQTELDEANPLHMNPPRTTRIPSDPDAMLVVLAHPPEQDEAPPVTPSRI